VVDAAQAANRLLAVDLSYRFTAAVRRLREIIRAGGLGRVYALDLVFHNAYGPDKPWFYDPALSGGGCVMDLGVHLVDLALWLLGFPKVLKVTSSLWSRAAPLEAALRSAGGAVEDYAVAALELEGEVIVRLACSWNLHAGRPAEISAAVHGSTAGARFRNVDGSFYDFALELNHGPSCETLLSPPDDWGGRAAAAFARRLAEGQRYDPRARDLVAVSEALDAIYAAAGPRPSPPLEGARGPSEGPHP
jgi:predicted dehydrogenase